MHEEAPRYVLLAPHVGHRDSPPGLGQETDQSQTSKPDAGLEAVSLNLDVRPHAGQICSPSGLFAWPAMSAETKGCRVGMSRHVT